MTYFPDAHHGVITRAHGTRRRRSSWPPPGWTPEPEQPPVRDRSCPTMWCSEVRSRATGKVVQWSFECPGCGQEHRHAPSPGLRESHCADRPVEPLRLHVSAGARKRRSEIGTSFSSRTPDILSVAATDKPIPDPEVPRSSRRTHTGLGNEGEIPAQGRFIAITGQISQMRAPLKSNHIIRS